MSSSRATASQQQYLVAGDEDEDDYSLPGALAEDNVTNGETAMAENSASTDVQDNTKEAASTDHADDQQQRNAMEINNIDDQAVSDKALTPLAPIPVEESAAVTTTLAVDPSPNKGIFPWWTRLTDKMHRGITRFVVTMSLNAAKNPKTCIVGVLLLSFSLVGIGFFTNFRLELDENVIYAPSDSIPQDHFAWRNDKSGFLESTRVTTLVIHADGANVLGKEPMDRVFEALDIVRNIPGYQDICEDGDYYDERSGAFTCRIISATRYWYHDTELYHQEIQTDAELTVAISQSEYPGGVPADHEYVMGKIERIDNGYGNGTITYVPAHFVYILLSNKEEQTMEFEKLVIEQLSTLQATWAKEDGSLLRLSYFAERSFSDEFTRAIEEDMFLVPLIFIMMSGFTCLVFFQKDRVQSRSGLGVGSVTTIGMSLMSGFGLLFICGVPYTSMTTILPFVVFGVGLDDTFIITGSYLRTDVKLDIEERIRITMEEVGTSITVTTVTTMVAFILGLTSSVPAIYWLCLYAFPTIFIDYIYQITFFVAIMVLDEKRIQAEREDIFVCFQRPQVDLSIGMENSGQEAQLESLQLQTGGAVQQKHIADRCMAWYAKQLLRPVSKGVVVVVFAYFFALCIYRTTMLSQEFDVTELFPDGSYCTDALDKITEYQERSLQVEVYFRNVNQSDPEIQDQMIAFVDELAAYDAFGQQPPLCWVRDFRLLRESAFWDDLGVDGLSFEDQLQLALSEPAINEAFGMDIVHENGNISASRCIVVMKNSYLDAVDDQISVLVDQRAITDAQPLNSGLIAGAESFFTFNQVYLLWEFYNIAVSALISTTVSSVIAVSVVALVFIPHWSGLLFVIPMVCIVYIDLLGTMQMAGLHVNAVTYVCLVISIGLIVDFIMHIILRYNESTYKTREGRVKDTLETMGSSILLGGLTTMLGVLPLAFSTSTILRSVFTSLFAMIVLGVTHGLILLPVFLSAFGPYTAIRENDVSNTKEESSSPTTPGTIQYDSTFDSDGSSGKVVSEC